MRVLSLDTTTPTLSTAVVEDDRVLALRVGGAARTHAAHLPGELVAVLRSAAADIATIDLFAVAAGPGSFTGLRIGIATIQGLAFVTARPVVAVSVLDALAHAVADGETGAAAPPGTTVATWVDAHRGEVFSARYRIDGSAPYTRERLVELEPASVADPAVALADWQASGTAPDVIVGSGAQAYAQVIGGRTRIAASPTLAAVIGRIAVARARAGDTISPAAVQPLYVRRPDAEVARDRDRARHSRATPGTPSIDADGG
jgi:tRNA threonylcarbamoyladenosine biosynthesis protein TsaB